MSRLSDFADHFSGIDLEVLYRDVISREASLCEEDGDLEVLLEATREAVTALMSQD